MKRRDNKKNLRKMKNSHGIVSFLLFFLGLTLFLGVLATVMGVFLSNIISNKIDDEYARIKKDAEIYEKSADDTALLNYLNMDDQTWIVRDANGTVKAQNGENSCGTEKQVIVSATGLFALLTENRVLSGYEDTKENVLYGSDGEMDIDLARIADMLAVNINFNGDKTSDPDRVHVEYTEQEMVEMPYWISIPLKDGNEYIGKAYFTIGTKDLFFLLAVMIVLVLFILVMTIILIGKLIRNIMRNRRISHIFYTDEVTKGKNRMWFLIKGEQMLKKGSNAGHPFAIVSLSMVRYNNFCVTHSIAEGEALLRVLMLVLQRAVNKKEMVVHNGSAEFALILQEQNEDQIRGRLMALMGQLDRADSRYRCCLHAGVNILPPNLINGKVKRRKDLDLEKEYNNACVARATLEESDDSAVAFFDAKLIEEQRWIETVQQLQERALAEEQFLVYYQPKYSPDTEELKGAEALIRWQSPQFGLVSPGRFIPIFEKNGFITEIDHYMIRHVAADQKAWLDAGKKCVPVSVNVSRAHFIEPDLAEQIRDMVDEAGAPRELIEIELTESAFFDDKLALINIINQLKSYGFTVSMDDFGSGYSSLNSLKDMALDVLKLDADFFRSIPAAPVKKAEEKKAEETAAGSMHFTAVKEEASAAEAEQKEEAAAGTPEERKADTEAAAAEGSGQDAEAAAEGSSPGADAKEEAAAAEAEQKETAAAGMPQEEKADTAAATDATVPEEKQEEPEKLLPAEVKKEEKKEHSAGEDRARIVVQEAIRLARALNMRTVAEGVEEKDQVDFLAEQGCDMIQGFYFAKPMPKNEYEQRLK